MHDVDALEGGRTESPEGRVNAVGSVGGCHDDDVSPLLETVHEGEQLGHNAPLHLAVCLWEGTTVSNRQQPGHHGQAKLV